jgi:hypothetical protein
MDNLDIIIEKYKALRTEELIELARNPHQLELGVIPHLQAELFNRNKKEEAILLSEFLVKRPRAVAELPREELAQMIKERVDSGELLESIKLDLKDKGVDLFDILHVQNKMQDKAIGYLTSLKDEGMNDEEIDEKMKSNFSLTPDETDILKRELKVKGKQNLIIGYTLVISMSILSVVVLSMGGYIGIGGLLLVAIGVWRIIEGHRQRK